MFNFVCALMPHVSPPTANQLAQPCMACVYQARGHLRTLRRRARHSTPSISSLRWVTAMYAGYAASERAGGPTVENPLELTAMRRPGAPRRPRTLTDNLPGARRAPNPGFIEPCLATAASQVPQHGARIHECGSPQPNTDRHCSNSV
jgi:hypothetical protein